MTCHDARERLSDLLDGLLAEPEQTVLTGHLATCPECVRELDGLRQTVGLLRRVQVARAPAGFVDRVMERVAPEPWLRRALRASFVPLGIKLPAQAAAVALLTIGSVYVFQRTPELQKAARTEVPGGWSTVPATPGAAPHLAPRSADTDRAQTTPPAVAMPPASPAPALSSGLPAGERPPGAPPADVRPKPATRLRDPDVPSTMPGASQYRARPLQEGESPARDAVALAPAPATPAHAPAGMSHSEEAMAREKGDARGTAPPAASPPDAGSEPPPPSQTAPPPQTGAGTTGYSAASGPIRRPDERLVRRSAAPPPEPTPPTHQGQVSRAAKVVEPADVTGRLVPSDRAALSAALAELIARAGGAEAARRPEGSDLVIEVVVPRAAYADFARGLAGLGQWVVARAAPDLPPAVRVLISIAP